MPDLLTKITEIVTGLGMSGVDTLPEALTIRPRELVNVAASDWHDLQHAFASGANTQAFETSWANGRAFFESPDGLRGRKPLAIEWKGSHKLPGFDFLPADLRIDHVYLVSCKYGSRLLTNSSPSNLFERRLADRAATSDAVSWFESCASDEYQYFYSCVRRYVGQALLPQTAQDLTTDHVQRIRLACRGAWPRQLVGVWREFSFVVAEESARRWRRGLQTPGRREEMLWRLLRLGPAPYFVLGSSSIAGPTMRLRIGTPWDWRQLFTLDGFDVAPEPAGQPRVSWSAKVSEKNSGCQRGVRGHVEIRWAHGRYSSVEAKVYLDTPHAEVPGYFPLAEP